MDAQRRTSPNTRRKLRHRGRCKATERPANEEDCLEPCFTIGLNSLDLFITARGLILSRAFTLLGTGLGWCIVCPSLTFAPLVYVGSSHRAVCPGVVLTNLDSSASIHRGR